MKNTVTTALSFIERHKKAASGAALVLAVLLVFAIVNSPAVVGASATRRSLPVYSVERDGKFVALSCDAAWGNEDTEELIEILQKYDVKATFFLVGQWVDKYPESVKQLSDAGMEVMNHSNDHAHCEAVGIRDRGKRERLQREDRGYHRRPANALPLPLRGV